jgi:hypothetical protein
MARGTARIVAIVAANFKPLLDAMRPPNYCLYWLNRASPHFVTLDGRPIGVPLCV